MRRSIRFPVLILALTALVAAGGCQNKKPPERSEADLNGTWVQSRPDGTAEGEQIIQLADGRGAIRLVFFDDPDDEDDDDPADRTIIFNAKILSRSRASVFVEIALADDGDQAGTSRLEYKFLSDDRIECLYENHILFLDKPVAAKSAAAHS